MYHLSLKVSAQKFYLHIVRNKFSSEFFQNTGRKGNVTLAPVVLLFVTVPITIMVSIIFIQQGVKVPSVWSQIKGVENYSGNFDQLFVVGMNRNRKF